MDVLVTGASGLIGSALVPALRASGHRVVRAVRRPARGEDEIAWDPEAGTIDRDALEGIDAVVHLAGVGIGDRRWSAATKRAILSSRVVGTTLLATTLANLSRPPRVLVSASGVNVYGDRGDEVLDEQSAPGSGFLADVVQQWERASEPAKAAGIRVVYARNGVVLDREATILRRQLPLFRLGIGGPIGRGRQWLSWVSRRDAVAALVHLLESDLEGPVNVTSPNPVTNAEFARTLGRVLRRPAVLPVPAFAPALLYGRELVKELIVESRRVRPKALEASGFTFTDPDLESCLRHALDSS